MSLTLNESGVALTETVDEVSMPVNFSFKIVNDFVNSHQVSFEELQCLCLAMSDYIEKLKNV